MNELGLALLALYTWAGACTVQLNLTLLYLSICH